MNLLMTQPPPKKKRTKTHILRSLKSFNKGRSYTGPPLRFFPSRSEMSDDHLDESSGPGETQLGQATGEQ